MTVKVHVKECEQCMLSSQTPNWLLKKISIYVVCVASCLPELIPGVLASPPNTLRPQVVEIVSCCSLANPQWSRRLYLCSFIRRTRRNYINRNSIKELALQNTVQSYKVTGRWIVLFPSPPLILVDGLHHFPGPSCFLVIRRLTWNTGQKPRNLTPLSCTRCGSWITSFLASLPSQESFLQGKSKQYVCLTGAHKLWFFLSPYRNWAKLKCQCQLLHQSGKHRRSGMPGYWDSCPRYETQAEPTIPLGHILGTIKQMGKLHWFFFPQSLFEWASETSAFLGGFWTVFFHPSMAALLPGRLFMQHRSRLAEEWIVPNLLFEIGFFAAPFVCFWCFCLFLPCQTWFHWHWPTPRPAENLLWPRNSGMILSREVQQLSPLRRID